MSVEPVLDGWIGRYGRVAAVLGAGQGIGRAFALAAAERGLDVLVVDVQAGLLSAVADEVRALGREAHTLQLDLGSSEAGPALGREARRHEIGLAVCSAALSPIGPLLAQPADSLRRTLALNCGGPLAAAQALGPAMVERGRGALVLLSSLAGLQGTGHVAAYSATKAFDIALAEALWWELGEAGVHVLGLLAGSTDTPGFRASGARLADDAALDRPEDVAQEGLDHLADGPLWIAGERNRKIAEALGGMSRSERVRMISETTRALYADRPDDHAGALRGSSGRDG